MSREFDQPRLKRMASQIMLQFPTDKAEALMVLGFLKILVEWENGAEATILPFARLISPEL